MCGRVHRGRVADEDPGRRQSDRAGPEVPQAGDAEGRPVQGDEAAGLLREAFREAQAKAGRSPEEATEGLGQARAVHG